MSRIQPVSRARKPPRTPVPGDGGGALNAALFALVGPGRRPVIFLGAFITLAALWLCHIGQTVEAAVLAAPKASTRQ